MTLLFTQCFAVLSWDTQTALKQSRRVGALSVSKDYENIHRWFQRTVETAQPTMHKLWVWRVTSSLFFKGRADDLDSEEQVLAIHSQLKKRGFVNLKNSREDKAYNHIHIFCFSPTRCILFFAWDICIYMHIYVYVKMRTCRKLSMGEVRLFCLFLLFCFN